MDVEISPIYIKDPTRPSLSIEIETIQELWLQLYNDSRTVANIKPVTWIEFEQIPHNKAITEAFERIRKEISLESLYEYIARLAIEYPGVEIGIEKPNGEYSGCSEAISKFGRLKRANDVYVLDCEGSTQDLLMLFGNISFPIIDKTELEMLHRIREWGYVDLMKGIHFCYQPIHGQPCGFCRPCQQKIECGMAVLLPRLSRIRYKLYRNLYFLRPLYRAMKKTILHGKTRDKVG